MPPTTKKRSPIMPEVTLRDVHGLLEKLRDDQRRERDSSERRIVEAVRTEVLGMREALELHKQEVTGDVAKHELILYGDGDLKPGLLSRVRDHDRHFRLVAWLGGPLLITVLSGLLGLIWALLIGKVELLVH